MNIEINGKQILGLDKQVLRALIHSACPYCTHRAITHREEGCKAVFDNGDPCPCKRGYTSYLLLKDDDFVQEIITEGLLF